MMEAFLEKDFEFTPEIMIRVGMTIGAWCENNGYGYAFEIGSGFPITDPMGTGSSTQFHFSGGSRF